MKGLWGGLALSTVVSASLYGQEHEQKIRLADLPPPVAAAAAAEVVRGGRVLGYAREWESGQTFYEASLLVNGHSKDVLMDSSGAVVEVEEEVSLDTLPAAVQAALRRGASGGKICRVEALRKRGRLVAYEAHLTRAGRREIQVGPAGEKLDHQE
jgi:hypothetical protein